MAVERQTLQTLHVYPKGPDGELPAAFRLELHTDYLRRDARSPAWTSEIPTLRTTVLKHVTRSQLTTLITEAAQALADDGTS